MKTLTGKELEIMDIESFVRQRLETSGVEIVSSEIVDDHLNIYTDYELEESDCEALEKDCLLKFNAKVWIMADEIILVGEDE